MDLFDEVPRVALAVYAHPDDAEVACGGTLALWTDGGCEVHVLVVTSGDKGTTTAGVVPEELARVRRGEMEEASGALGLAGRLLLGYPDGEVDNTLKLRRELVVAVRSLRPEVVLCPDPTATFFGERYVNHRDHREVGWATLDAVSPAAALPLYFPDAGPPHQVGTILLSGSLEPDVAVDISKTMERKILALSCHRTQVGTSTEWVESMVRRRAEEAGHAAKVRYAETFRRQFVD